MSHPPRLGDLTLATSKQIALERWLRVKKASKTLKRLLGFAWRGEKKRAQNTLRLRKKCLRFSKMFRRKTYWLVP